jgi:hypothetical protein
MVILLVLLVLLCYAAVWLDGDIWASVWRTYHRSDDFVPLPSYHREDYMPK